MCDVAVIARSFYGAQVDRAISDVWVTCVVANRRVCQLRGRDSGQETWVTGRRIVDMIYGRCGFTSAQSCWQGPLHEGLVEPRRCAAVLQFD
jgi:hypothetical protein